MRKAIAWLCFVLLLCGILPALAEESVGPASVQRGTSVTVASPNEMSGYFATEMWGNNTADMDARVLLHGYETVAWTRGVGLSINNTVITGIQTADAADGSMVYTLQIADGLTYNDGTPITARDYAFYYLLSGAPEIEAIGGTTQGLSHIKGYDAYQQGQTKTLEGVRVLADNILQITVDGSYFPYFYGLVLLSARPYPISVIAPGCTVQDDGNGVSVSGTFTADVLRQTMLDPDSGYVFNPQVTCGPYSLESYDQAANVATFVVNERFIGNYEGQKPVIERIVFRHGNEADTISMLTDGGVDLVNKIGDMNGITSQLDTRGEDMNTLSLAQINYLRTGFAFLAFACEESPTDSAAVRQAINMSIDKDSLIAETMPNVAMRVDGYYGLGQWMVTYSDDGEVTGKAPMQVVDELVKLQVPYDISAAAALLVSDGWTLNADGQAYDVDNDDVRYKQVDGRLVPLEIRWAVTEATPFVDYLRGMLERTLPAMGISLVVEEMDFPTLLTHYYRQTDRTYNMFYMASNFGFVFDPYYDFNTADVYQGMVNTSGLKDEELMNLARDMRETDPADYRAYVDKWIVFQQKFAELMPMVPLYSNLYLDMHTDRLMNYDILGNTGWSYAILYAYIGD